MWWNSTWCTSTVLLQMSRFCCLQKCTEHGLVNGKKRSVAMSFGEGWETRSDHNADWAGNGTADLVKFPSKSSLCTSIFPSLLSAICLLMGNPRKNLNLHEMSELCKAWWFSSSVYKAFWPLTTHLGQKDSKKGSTKKKKKR